MFSELSGSVVDMDAIVVNTQLMAFFSPRCVLIYIVPDVSFLFCSKVTKDY